jgi:hypothetical protein
MPIEFGLLRFPSAKFELYEILQHISNNVVGIILVILGRKAQSILVSEMVNHYIAYSDIG